MNEEKLNDRIDLLRHLGFEDTGIFKDYIPDHYDEIYNLYSMLRDANVDYNDIEFKKPKVSESSFVFSCICESEKDIDKLQTFITTNPTMKYLRNTSYNVTLKVQEKIVSIKFKKK